MKLWIDDVRPAPDGYIWALSVTSAKNDILRYERMGEPLELIDIDHDAGEYFQYVMIATRKIEQFTEKVSNFTYRFVRFCDILTVQN